MDGSPTINSGNEGFPIMSPPGTNSVTIRRIFFPIVLFSQICAAVILGLVIAWMKSYGGFGWTVDFVFNYHPLFMGAGMLFLHGEAILIYRLFRYKSKKVLKLSHAFLHAVSIMFSIIGLKAVFDFHNWKNIPNLYSLHSWVGLGLVILYVSQFLLGFGIFLLPYASLPVRSTYLPLHRVFGVIMFVLAGATALMGITEKAIFSSKDCWAKRDCATADVINWLGISIVGYVASVAYIVTTPEYKRQPLPTD